eukprot:296779_1
MINSFAFILTCWFMSQNVLSYPLPIKITWVVPCVQIIDKKLIKLFAGGGLTHLHRITQGNDEFPCHKEWMKVDSVHLPFDPAATECDTLKKGSWYCIETTECKTAGAISIKKGKSIAATDQCKEIEESDLSYPPKAVICDDCYPLSTFKERAVCVKQVDDKRDIKFSDEDIVSYHWVIRRYRNNHCPNNFQDMVDRIPNKWVKTRPYSIHDSELKKHKCSAERGHEQVYCVAENDVLVNGEKCSETVSKSSQCKSYPELPIRTEDKAVCIETYNPYNSREIAKPLGLGAFIWAVRSKLRDGKIVCPLHSKWRSGYSASPWNGCRSLANDEGYCYFKAYLSQELKKQKGIFGTGTTITTEQKILYGGIICDKKHITKKCEAKSKQEIKLVDI